MARKPIPPKYRRQRRAKGSDTAFAEVAGQRVYLGAYGSKESRERYRRLLAESVGGGGQRQFPRTDISVNECTAAYWQFALHYYRKNDQPTTEVAKIRVATRVLVRLYGSTAAAEFGPLRLKTCRQAFIEAGNSRKVVNEQAFRIRRLFKWCASEELIPESVDHGLRTVQSLRRGRTAAWDAKPTRPVPDEFVDRIKPFVSRQAWAIVALQRLTGMRSGEVVVMRGCDLDMTGRLWLYRPMSHKTEHYGSERIVDLGSRAQQVIGPFLKANVQAYLFAPADAEAERRAELHAKRKTPMSCGNRPGTNRKRKPKRTPRERYTSDSYGRAVARACDLADLAAKKGVLLPKSY